MKTWAKWMTIALAAGVLSAGTVAVGAATWNAHPSRQAAASDTPTDEAHTETVTAAESLVFRSTEPGAGYGHIARVPLKHPSSPRTITPIICDRVDATMHEIVCLRTVRGIVPSYTGAVHDDHGVLLHQWPLTGIPSRTRLSPSGDVIATTAFVTGHSYASLGFSTATTIRLSDGTDLGNLEPWTLSKSGDVIAPIDRNFWGVTFVDDDTFYATVGFTQESSTALVKGSVSARTLTVIDSDVECPSVSPDGSRLAYKKVTGGAGVTAHWTPAILSLDSGAITVLDAETRSIDDQIEWLDDHTLLYALARPHTPGDSDIWALPLTGGDPRVFVEHAWSPSVVRR